MTARFILSIDCEGKWGVADLLSRRHHQMLSEERLRSAYNSVISLLDGYSIPATFAFVGIFVERKEQFERLGSELDDLAAYSPYLRAALEDCRNGSREGWHGDWALHDVGSARVPHEIALHGITHIPWGSASRQLIERELKLHPFLNTKIREAMTFVFPRNEIAHVDLLKSIGICGYRQAKLKRSRLVSLVAELDIRAKPEEPRGEVDGLVPIPAGYFVNWQSGARRIIPRLVTRARVRQLLDRAEDSGEIVHFWFHPENVASAPTTLDVLRDILEVVMRQREKGACEVLTQSQYVRWVRNSANGLGRRAG